MISNKLDRNGRVVLPAMHLPGFRSSIAIETGVEKNLLFRTWGGLGDQICAEPTLRFALDKFKGCRISLASEQPSLFRHLKFDDVIDLRKVKPIYENYLMFDTITPPDDSNLVWQFFSHMLTNCVDFPSLCALRSQLPISSRQVILTPSEEDSSAARTFHRSIPRAVFIHAGKHWPSKTFPKDWWDEVITELLRMGAQPVLIGANTDDNRGTVDVEPAACIDLRNKLSVMQTVAHLEQARVLLTNDSSPLHMAVTGRAWIGFIATCKHPDFITHWRNGEWGWRMHNHGKGGVWDLTDYCPNKADQVTAEFVDESVLRSWLPSPKEYAEWASNRLTSS